MLFIINSVRGILATSIFVSGIGAFIIGNNSKDKSSYIKTTGLIEYLEPTYLHLPSRKVGDYVYLKLDSYPYVFEVYKPNSKETELDFDDLTQGDEVDVYHYEIDNTHKEGINRFTQFIDKSGFSVFIRNDFQKLLGLILIALALLLNVMGFAFWKMGKLDW